VRLLCSLAPSSSFFRAAPTTPSFTLSLHDALPICGGATSLEQMMNQLKADGMAKFPLVIKGDVQGSVEAIVGSLDKLATDEVSRSEEHTSELQSRENLVCRLLLEKKKTPCTRKSRM